MPGVLNKHKPLSPDAASGRQYKVSRLSRHKTICITHTDKHGNEIHRHLQALLTPTNGSEKQPSASMKSMTTWSTQVWESPKAPACMRVAGFTP